MTLAALKKKLALGTVQLGIPYGINNTTGKPNLEASFSILNCAQEHGIGTLDSADAYGDSIHVIGSYFKAFPGAKFNIISKFVDDGHPLREKLDKSLSELSIGQLYGYMYHRFADYQKGTRRNELKMLKEQNKIERIGVSLYSLPELEVAVRDEDISLIQIPFNPLDSSPDKLALLKQAKSAGKEIHVRSVFLQGLFFKKPQDLTGNLTGLKEPLHEFQAILRSWNLNATQACLNYALHEEAIDIIIIGVETTRQLQENVEAIMPSFSAEIVRDLRSIRVMDTSLLNPSSWVP